MSTPNDVVALRDYFAAAALSGAIVNHKAGLDAAYALLEETPAQKTTKAAQLATAFNTIARLAYDCAEAVIAERNKRFTAQEVAIAA